MRQRDDGRIEKPHCIVVRSIGRRECDVVQDVGQADVRDGGIDCPGRAGLEATYERVRSRDW